MAEVSTPYPGLRSSAAGRQPYVVPRWTVLVASFALTLSLAVPFVYGAPERRVETASGASAASQPAAIEPVTEASSSSIVREAPAESDEPLALPAAAPAPPAVQAAPPSAAPPSAPAAALTPAERWARESFIFQTEGQEWTASSVANVDAALSALPRRVRAMLGNPALGPLHILVNRDGRTLSGNSPYGRAANFFATSEGSNELVLYPDQSPRTIVHELGHAYNLRRTPAGRYALVLLDPEMQSFLAATGWRITSMPDEIRAARDHTQVSMVYEGQRVWTNVSNDDPLEDFANSFALFFLSPDELRQLSPARYDWFAANVGR